MYMHHLGWGWVGWGGGGVADGLVLGWRLGMVDWVKWTVTTIWFALTWSSCFPYFPFVCPPGSGPMWGEWCDTAWILSFQLHPLSLLLSTAATSTAYLLSIIFQIEFELKTKGVGLTLLTLKKTHLEYFYTDMCILHILTILTAKTFLWPLGLNVAVLLM